jgi:hypothetical protein
MKIKGVRVVYGELRSTGYPNYSNKRHEIALEADLTEGDTARGVCERLRAIAMQEVKKLFGDETNEVNEMDIPF